MFVRHPDYPALETVDSTDSVPARAQSTPIAAAFAHRDVRDACNVTGIECVMAPTQTTSAGKTHALTDVLRAWAHRAAAGRRRARAYHRKRPHEPTLPLLAALDFATKLDVRFDRAARGGAVAAACRRGA